MKKSFIFCLLLLFFGIQITHGQKLNCVESICISVDNSNEPTQIAKTDIGKVLTCNSGKGDFRLGYRITKRIFLEFSGSEPLLVSCQGEGFIFLHIVPDIKRSA